MSAPPDPSFRRIMAAGLPHFLLDGLVPLGAFYAGWKLGGLVPGVLAATSASAGLWLLERLRGRETLLVRLSFAFVLVQAVTGLVSHSSVVYLAQPVLANAAWGLLFLGSVAAGRPLAGTLARSWYPFPGEIVRTASFRRVYGFESAIWGAYLLARSALRLAALLHGGIGSFVVVSILSGTPAAVVLLAWSVAYAIRRLPVELARESGSQEATAAAA
jgi:hypothetical protein